jgi:hypothetical protein
MVPNSTTSLPNDQLLNEKPLHRDISMLLVEYPNMHKVKSWADSLATTSATITKGCVCYL